jgi:hypothetical protein
MTPDDPCKLDDWVEIEYVLLEPADRSPSLPQDTAAQPLTVWLKGFARGTASLGEQVTVETATGRLVTGRLTSTTPGYYHTFGDPIRELVHVGRDLRARLAGVRGDKSPGGSGGPARGGA